MIVLVGMHANDGRFIGEWRVMDASESEHIFRPRTYIDT